MRHRKAGRRLGRNRSHRKAVLRNLAMALFEHERIRSTDAKCKELRPFAERIITTAKKGLPAEGDDSAEARARAVHARRQIGRFIHRRDVVEKIFSVLAPRYRERSGGYTRIVKVGPRPGDNADCSIIEFVDRPG
jgi:large subunit ribosomal protein L17